MCRILSTTLAMILLATVAQAQTDIDFQRLFKGLEAERALQANKYDQAHEGFSKLSQSADDQSTKAKWAGRAAVALGSQKEKYEAGLAAARAIEVRPYSVTAQLEMMLAHKDHAAMVKAVGDEAIADWPAMEMPQRDRIENEDARVYAGYARAQAFMETGDFKKADADYALAGSLAKTSSLAVDIWLAAGRNRERNLKDAASAHEAYMNAVVAGKGRGNSDYFSAIMSSVRYLIDQGQYDQAIEVLAPMEPQTREGTWGAQANLALGEALVGKKQWDEALAAYDRVIDSDTSRPAHRVVAMAARAKALVAAGRIDEARAAYQRMIDDEASTAAQKAAAKKAMEKL